jgi:hypothetical protein
MIRLAVSCFSHLTGISESKVFLGFPIISCFPLRTYGFLAYFLYKKQAGSSLNQWSSIVENRLFGSKIAKK